MAKKIGILAYGSVIDSPGVEIEKATLERIEGVETPFKIEFARESGMRAGAPTLVPVEEGGANVKAVIFVVDATEADAADMLYRREIDEVESAKRYVKPKEIKDSTTVIERLENVGGVDVVFYAWLTATIKPLTAEKLADLAVQSARKLGDGRDGISYLINAKKNGITTPLSDAYKKQIIDRVGAATLEEALAKIRAGPKSSVAKDGSILGDNGKVIFFSLERFKEDICLGDACFICGIAPSTADFNNEHVLPQWLLRKFNLHNRRLTLPNGVQVAYGQHTVPCCRECNTLLGRELEEPMRALMTNGFKALSENIGDAIPVIFRWLCLTVFKNHYRDRLLRMKLDRRAGDEMIGDMYEWGELHHMHAVARTAYSGCTIDPEVIGSMHLFGLIPNEIDEKFDFCDLYQSQAVLLRIDDIAIVAVLNDSSGALNGFMHISKRITGSVTSIQLREILAHLATINLYTRERPVYSTEFDADSGKARIRAKIPKYFAMNVPDRDVLGRIMEQTCGDIIKRIGAPDAQETLEEIRTGQYTFLFKDDGTFNDQSLVKVPVE